MPVDEHGLAELIHAAPARHPARRNNHTQVSRVQLYRLLYEQVIDGGVVGSATAAGHLIRRVADDHVESHSASEYLSEPGFDVVDVNESVSMCFKPGLAVENRFRRAAENALRSLPGVFQPLEPDVAALVCERLGDR